MKVDITGKRFGNLLAIIRIGSLNKNGQWLCECTCGNFTIASLCHLKLGHTKSCGCLRRKNGSNHPNWKGDDVAYTTFHHRLDRLNGRPTYCEICGMSDPERKYNWASMTKDYGDLSDYKRLCISCHRKFDNAQRRESGGIVAQMSSPKAIWTYPLRYCYSLHICFICGEEIKCGQKYYDGRSRKAHEPCAREMKENYF